MMTHSRSLKSDFDSAADPEMHFRITTAAGRRGFEGLSCLLARVWRNGSIELLNPAWDKLGYSSAELGGRPFCELIALDSVAACAATRALLTEEGSVEFDLRCKDGRTVRHHWARELDEFTDSMFIVGEEVVAGAR
jgi:hypothetical protein